MKLVMIGNGRKEMEVNPMDKKIEELQAENEARREMWDVLKIAYDTELYGLKGLTLKKVMEDIEQKYLGGGE